MFPTAAATCLLSLFLTSPAESSPADTQPAATQVRASDLLHEYWNYGEATGRKYRGRVLDVVGVVANVKTAEAGSRQVDLETGETGYAVRCVFADEPATASLEKGQLVAARCTGGGVVKDNPQLTACRITWAGEKPSAPASPEARDASASLAAASVRLCAADRLRKGAPSGPGWTGSAPMPPRSKPERSGIFNMPGKNLCPAITPSLPSFSSAGPRRCSSRSAAPSRRQRTTNGRSASRPGSAWPTRWRGSSNG